MLLAVMGSGSHLKRPWDESELDESQDQQQHISASSTQSGRKLSIDLSSPATQTLPPILATHERPQVLRQHSRATLAEADEPPDCKTSPRPHTEGSGKRPRLFYNKKESGDTERFDHKRLLPTSSVRNLSFCFLQTKSNTLMTVAKC
jgi:hypothetical protein